MNRITIFEGYGAAGRRVAGRTPAQQRVQKRFKQCASTCSGGKTGKYPKCMRTCLRRKPTTTKQTPRKRAR